MRWDQDPVTRMGRNKGERRASLYNIQFKGLDSARALISRSWLLIVTFVLDVVQICPSFSVWLKKLTSRKFPGPGWDRNHSSLLPTCQTDTKLPPAQRASPAPAWHPGRGVALWSAAAAAAGSGLQGGGFRNSSSRQGMEGKGRRGEAGRVGRRSVPMNEWRLDDSVELLALL